MTRQIWTTRFNPKETPGNLINGRRQDAIQGPPHRDKVNENPLGRISKWEQLESKATQNNSLWVSVVVVAAAACYEKLAIPFVWSTIPIVQALSFIPGKHYAEDVNQRPSQRIELMATQHLVWPVNSSVRE